jgi:glycerol uptake facilitator-like aquaporin
VADVPIVARRQARRLRRAGRSQKRAPVPTFDLKRRLVGEALGTALLVATVVGSGIMAESLTRDVALALLGNTLATGAMLVVLINLFGPVSGAHFNPVVTLVFALKNELATRDAVFYVVVQVIGGIVGAWLAHAMFELPLLQISLKARTGSGQWLSEGIATFGLLSTILAGRRFAGGALPMLVGLYISAAYWFTASTSFANPAVTIARAFSNSFSGIRLQDVTAFIAAQACGALLALALFGWLLGDDGKQSKEVTT